MCNWECVILAGYVTYWTNFANNESYISLISAQCTPLCPVLHSTLCASFGFNALAFSVAKCRSVPSDVCHPSPAVNLCVCADIVANAVCPL